MLGWAVRVFVSQSQIWNSKVRQPSVYSRPVSKNPIPASGVAVSVPPNAGIP